MYIIYQFFNDHFAVCRIQLFLNFGFDVSGFRILYHVTFETFVLWLVTAELGPENFRRILSDREESEVSSSYARIFIEKIYPQY